MSNTVNPMTEGLKLVQTDTVHSFWRIFGQTVSFEDGFSLELFRGGAHLGSILSNQVQLVAQMKQRFLALGAKDGDTIYRINLGPRMQQVQGRLRTQDGYTREYKVIVELQVLDSSQFIKLYLQGADPVNLVILSIVETIQEYADRTIYEKMHPTNIQAKAMYAFDREPGNLRAGIHINRAYQPFLGDDKAYQPINLSPLLNVSGKLTTHEGYMRDYAVTVELEIIDPVLHQQLDRQGTAPFDLAKITIDGALQIYARNESYERLSELQLRNIVEHAFDTLPSRATGGLKIVRAHHFSLKAAPDYINLGHRTFTLTGKLATTDFYERDYEMTVELEIGNPTEFIRLTREGNDPLHLARVVIEGAIQHAAAGKAHDELPGVDLDKAAQSAFAAAPSSTIGGLKIVKAHKVFLRVDPRILERANIKHQTSIEKATVQNKAELEYLENELDFKSAQQIEAQELTLIRLRQEREKIQYIFELEKDDAAEAHRLRKALSQWTYSEWVARASEDMQANVSLQKIVEEMTTLRRILPTGLPQIAEQPNMKQLPEEKATDGQGQSQKPLRQMFENIELGLTLVEIRVPAVIRGLLNEQERAFQVLEVIVGGPAESADFQEADFLVKINGQYVYTADAIDIALKSIQLGSEMRVIVLRDEMRKSLIIAPLQPTVNADEE
jgi:hypothetical protein